MVPDGDRLGSGRGKEATGIEDFITRWRNSGGAERANYALFLSELCDLLGVPRPDAAIAFATRSSSSVRVVLISHLSARRALAHGSAP